jgi:DNA-directed RNA polymerase omega subunit
MIEKCLEKIPSRFELTTLVARRWESLIQGALPMVEEGDPRRLETVLQEIVDGKIELDTESRTIELKGEPVRVEEEEALFDEYLDANLLGKVSDEEE